MPTTLKKHNTIQFEVSHPIHHPEQPFPPTTGSQCLHYIPSKKQDHLLVTPIVPPKTHSFSSQAEVGHWNVHLCPTPCHNSSWTEILFCHPCWIQILEIQSVSMWEHLLFTGDGSSRQLSYLLPDSNRGEGLSTKDWLCHWCLCLKRE